jgi:hypothetical protein
VTKHGNPRLRAALVELAWRLVRFQPDYHPVRKWRQILAKGALATGAARKKAIVAVARQLAVDLWRIKTGRPRRRVGINQLVKFEGNRKENTLKEKLKPLWNAGAARCLTCSESLRVRRLRLGARPTSSST